MAKQKAERARLRYQVLERRSEVAGAYPRAMRRMDERLMDGSALPVEIEAFDVL